MHTVFALLVVVSAAAAAPPGPPVKGKPPAEPPPAPVEAVRALIMPVDVAAGVATVVGTDQRRRLENDVAAILQRFRRLTVLTSQDVRNLADLDANRQLSGCDTSCAAEIASALGARFVVGLRLEPGPQGLLLTVNLLDTNEAVILGKGRAQGARLADLTPQLPFAVKDAAASLEAPGDPTAAEILNDARPKLAVLPIRGDAHRPAGFALLVDEAVARLAPRLGLAAFDSERYAAAAAQRGCVVDDMGCALPATASTHNVTRGVGVSLNRAPGQSAQDSGRVVRAALLGVDGAVVARAEADVDGEGDPTAVARAVAQAIDALATPVAQKGSKSEPGKRRLRDRDSDDDDDRVLEDFPCTIYRGIEGVGARCELTKTVLRVTPHAFNFQSYAETVPLEDVVSVEAFNPLAIPSGIRLVMRAGQARDIVVGIGPRDRLLRRVDALIR